MESGDGPSVRLPARATRGKRLNKLIEEEDDADKAFWGQDAFNEEDQEEYVSEEEEQDVFDSDFDDDEDMEDDGEEEADERPQRKRKAPPGAAPKRPARKAATAAKAAITPKTQTKSFEAVFQDRLDGIKPDKSTPKAKAATPKRPRAEQDFELAEAGFERRSKRAVVVERNVEREQEERQRAKSRKPVPKKKPVVEERRLTQEEMLAEAAQTEIANLQSLEIMLAREEEIKRKAIIHKEAFAGPQIRYHSKDGHTVLEFTRMDAFPDVINAKAAPYPLRSVCAVTGLPAKYKDPLTGLPYATLEAFKTLRERWSDRGKRPRPASTGDEASGRRRAKLDAVDNVKLSSAALGLKRGPQKSVRGRPSRRASPRDGVSPGTSSAEERSLGPASPADLPPSRLSVQSGAEQPLSASEQPVTAEQRVSASEQHAPTVGSAQTFSAFAAEQPLPSLQDVTLDDFEVGIETAAGDEEPGRSSGPEVGNAQELRGENAILVAGEKSDPAKRGQPASAPERLREGGEAAALDAVDSVVGIDGEAGVRLDPQGLGTVKEDVTGTPLSTAAAAVTRYPQADAEETGCPVGQVRTDGSGSAAPNHDSDGGLTIRTAPNKPAIDQALLQ
ncbi:DNA-binding protein [Klebsormidium nitens]|uniref:DNA-binding protein n=1 Tax=Klebsormidium nitens TaxID=105231 RepID=A0A1Y1I6B1_KLENI|nr:DNA-binding protein [Klebsormidium nitens]|eukprot:GAQ86495.1 DNA-binding protein [Klebsormidium nitens]